MFTSFQVVYEKQPLTLPSYILGMSKLEALDSTLSTREEMLALLRQNLLKAQENMKRFEDAHMTFREFSEGDCVYLKLQPFHQS